MTEEDIKKAKALEAMRDQHATMAVKAGALLQKYAHENGGRVPPNARVKFFVHPSTYTRIYLGRPTGEEELKLWEIPVKGNAGLDRDEIELVVRYGDEGEGQPEQIKEWKDDPPEQDGDFFYTGPLPNGKSVVAIVQISTLDERFAFLWIPPRWRGDEAETGTLHQAPLAEWKGQWSGPEYGICHAQAGGGGR